MSCDTSVSPLDYRSITLQLVLVFILLLPSPPSNPLTQRIHFVRQYVAPPNDATLSSDEATKITCQIYNAYNCVLSVLSLSLYRSPSPICLLASLLLSFSLCLTFLLFFIYALVMAIADAMATKNAKSLLSLLKP